MAKDKSQVNTTEKLFDDQFDDEEVLFTFRKHPIVMRKGLVIASVALLAGPLVTLLLTYVQSTNPPSINFFYASLGASFLLSALLFFPAWIAWYYSYFIITNQRFIQITRKGLFHKTVVDMNLSQIQSMNYEVSGFQATVLKFGTIMVQTYMGDLVIHEVQHPEKVQSQIARVLRDNNITPVDMNTTDVQGEDDIHEETDE